MATEPGNQPSRLDIIDTFVVVSVATIIVIRTFLMLTGFPRIGGDSFHIAHMLWGGLALTVALLVSLLQRQANRELLAVLGGVGFGFFIDEIGKFVTADNNYFYNGSFFLMYVILIAVWLVSRLLVVRSEEQALFLPALWPKRRIEQGAIIAWALGQLIYLPVVALEFDYRRPLELLALAFVVVYFFALLIGFSYLLRRNTLRATSIFRLATFLSIITILPLDYINNPAYAFVSTLVSILVMIGLSEVSLRELIRRLFRFGEPT